MIAGFFAYDRFIQVPSGSFSQQSLLHGTIIVCTIRLIMRFGMALIVFCMRVVSYCAARQARDCQAFLVQVFRAFPLCHVALIPFRGSSHCYVSIPITSLLSHFLPQYCSRFTQVRYTKSIK